MSTVSNPYTFNIKSNCGFSTNPLLSNNKADLTMRYLSNNYSEEQENPEIPGETITINYTIDSLVYESAFISTGSLVPNTINGNTIIYICAKHIHGDLESYICDIKIKSSQRYSKIILNGHVFENCSVPYYSQSSDGVQQYYIETYKNIGLNLSWSWKSYDDSPCMVTIEFVV